LSLGCLGSQLLELRLRGSASTFSDLQLLLQLASPVESLVASGSVLGSSDYKTKKFSVVRNKEATSKES
jgi:uncharacterized protein YcfL